MPTYLIATGTYQIEKKIRDAWKVYKVRSADIGVIADRVEERGRFKYGTPFAFPEEIAEFDQKAKELREIEEYIALRQKWLNEIDPKRKQEDYKFNREQVERLQHELSVRQ